MTTTTPRVIADGFTFLECPRWHDGMLWVSDMHADKVFAITEAGAVQVVVDVPGGPGELGWLPDGSLVVVATRQRRVMRVGPGGLCVHADLRNIGATGHQLNDMCVDADGRCYIGEFGVDIHAWMNQNFPRVAAEGIGVLGQIAVPEGSVFVTHADGSINPDTQRLRFPNGSIVSRDRTKFIVAETLGLRLSCFDLAQGRLGRREIWDLGFTPDGISEADREGCIWIADPIGRAVRRVAPGGKTVAVIENERRVYACALGGSGGHSLFLCTSSVSDPRKTAALRDSRLEVVRVEFGLAGA